eukprot:TRINITY_DN38039_c0_g1_i1.p1 TRINITY_DN38039_c0_g1~~TRINITY_DN38039_c0_g1_i1.p1  ORF type:complete len:533 (-),score=44.25 TRINITY_DN38039_c0_g1_i1:68-1435(-)
MIAPDPKMFPSPESASDSDSPRSPIPQRLIDAGRMMKKKSAEFNTCGTAKTRRSQRTRRLPSFTADGVMSCSVALSATSCGAGALALPYAFSLVGLGLGLLTVTVVALVSALSLQILIIAARYTDSKSYATVMQLAIGSRHAFALLDIMIVMNGIGAIICTLIFEADFLSAACPPNIIPNRTLAVIGAAVAAWPLTLPADLAALRYVTALVPTLLLLTVIVVVRDAPAHNQELRNAGGHIVWWEFDLKRWLQACSIMINSFMNQQNAIPAGNELQRPSIARIVKATVNASIMNWVLYVTVGVAGYMSWGALTNSDFIINYPTGDFKIWLCRIGLSLIMYLVLPVALLPASKSFAQLVLLASGAQTYNVSRLLHGLSATVLLGCCTTVAVAVSDVGTVIGILGGLFATSLMFWFPAVILYRFLWPLMPRLFRVPILLALTGLGMAGWASVFLTYAV